MRMALLVMMVLFRPAIADAGVIAARNLSAGTVISAGDLLWSEDVTAGVPDLSMAVGQQTRVAIYQGRPVMAGALRIPVLINRNQIVRITFNAGMLRIETEGRALSEGSAGEVIRVMNLSSRSTISARVAEDGTLLAVSGNMELK
ncbi:MAG: flagellar basal body P-ring formation chaperone FlgA [Paracoccus sp. (in: a-proteobacteria)]